MTVTPSPATSMSFIETNISQAEPPTDSPLQTTSLPNMARSSSYTSSRTTSSQAQLVDKFAELRDAIFFSAPAAGFILSADETFAYPNVRVGSQQPDPVHIDDIEEFLKAWDCWDATFSRRLEIDEYPCIRLNRTRESFRSKRIGILAEDGKKSVLDARGELIFAPGNTDYLGGVVWLTELGEFEDVQRQEQEEALRSFETICDSLPHIVWIATADGLIDYFSQSWYNVTSRTPETSLGHAWRDGIHLDDLAETWAAFGRAMAFGMEQETHFRYKRHDGVWRWMTSRAKPKLDGSGKVLRWYGTTTDIHEIVITGIEAKKLEVENARLLTEEHAAKESSRLKGQFLAHMSHELRTPIAGIIGMVSLLRDTSMNAEQADFADCIKTSAGNLLTIVNDILDFSKIESGKLQIEEIPFSVSSVIEDVKRVWTHIAQQKGLEFMISSNISKDLKVLGDPTRIGQILSNLCSNAVKFTNSGSINFDTYVTEGENNVELRIVVEDSGIGIDQTVLAQLFTPFAQGDSSTARLYGGTGLGLIISRNLAQLMRGQFVLESDSSHGTKAILTVPLKIVHEPVVSVPERPTEALTSHINSRSFHKVPTHSCVSTPLADQQTDSSYSAASRPLPRRVQTSTVYDTRRRSRQFGELSILNTPGRGHFEIMPREIRSNVTVLIVEDNAINQRIAVKTVEKLGFKTRAASNGEEALEYLAENNDIDVVLMDCQMPILDGYEATRKLRSDEKFAKLELKTLKVNGWSGIERPSRKLKDIPVIALTASAIPGDREKCFKAGMSDYLTKPLDTAMLEKKVVRWVLGQQHDSTGANAEGIEF